MQATTEYISECKKYETEIAQQESLIAELEQLASQKQDAISRVVQEYESAANDLKSSIQYAESIQRAELPRDDEFKALFPDSFIFFEPRDIVSGDFYMCASTSDCKIAIVADCTGHGVPGGLLSMLGMSALKDLLSKHKCASRLDPAEMLDLVRSFFLSSLAEAAETDDITVSDGMDISLCIFDNDFARMRYAAANHTIYIARNGEISKLKGSRMPIGRYPKQDEPFVSYEIELQKGDMVYLCSDGIQDQFGSPQNIKFTTKRLAAMLLEHSAKDTMTQYADISAYVKEWEKGREQYDDQTLIGIRI
ncbi:MAG: SpoIIE family protein phosphatase [Bacteroidales bacterium]|nr:SpoIIE family protein phosphatase [Bacteroidales bacterium]